MLRNLVIDTKIINDNEDCYVIAEIGHNHQGELEKAKHLFRLAQECGVDAVKLQKRDNRTLYTAAMYNKPYEHRNSFGRTYGEHREFLEFGCAEYRALQAYARELGLAFFATAFDIPSADFLAELEMPAIKIASGDLRNLPLLRHVAHLQRPILLSTGGGELADIQRAYDLIMPINPQLCLLQCTAAYPASAEEMNLRVIATLRERFPDVVVGLSDHYNGISMAPVAYVLGARVIEKHFTANHTWRGSDHAMSLEPIGMAKMVRDLRRTRAALGHGVKVVFESEREAVKKMGKSLYAAHDLPAGRVLSAADIAIKSPGEGLSPDLLDQVLGRKTLRPLAADASITWEVLDGGALD
ncbi:MAG: N-acetylneuraminate synthase family protein [Caldilineales bacterium]|nr:N-acetylneuraminate synthase family protein [Caldilineales bacterium]